MTRATWETIALALSLVFAFVATGLFMEASTPLGRYRLGQRARAWAHYLGLEAAWNIIRRHRRP